ncbi:MAG: universal stress protein [Bacteroidales bacterium]|jgi:nucleotide-binding universal stress UspA family protein|nr:universal stress protein [Bacteroidales bacterium]MDD4216831.1 universal stress protein [Bacteroidales bacterium]MDY0142977.1 universal stress protein [Bacteroidales bacterium]
MRKNRILVPTNFSKQAEIAFKQSVFFSSKTNSDIFVLHVIPSLRKIDGSSNTIETIQNKADSLIDPMTSFAGGKIHTRIETGKVITQILNAEQELKPDYIFIGTDVSSKPLSSTTLRLLNHVDCPLVVFTNRSNKTGCDKIVLPLDLTKETKQKIDYTIKIAQVYNSEVHIVSATNFEDEIMCDIIKKQMSQVKSIFDKLELKSQIKLLKTKNDIDIMANEINDYADDINADLIVIMTRQETKLQKFFVGSMAIKLIRKSTVPIMCISPKIK